MNIMDKAGTEALTGGRDGEILRQGEAVIRPAGPWTEAVHAFLNFMAREGADFVPKPLGITKACLKTPKTARNQLKLQQIPCAQMNFQTRPEQNEEMLSYMPGEVYNYPLPEMLRGEAAWISAADLLHRFHAYGARYLPLLTGREQWMLPVVAPAETLCHGDFAPYNVTILNGRAAGLIDFDTLHPGPRMWDVAYGIYRWLSVTPDESGAPDTPEGLHEQIKMAKVFLDAYGADAEDRGLFVPMLIKRLKNLTDFMRAEAEKGNRKFIQDIANGHLRVYERDIAYFRKNAEEITREIG